MHYPYSPLPKLKPFNRKQRPGKNKNRHAHPHSWHSRREHLVKVSLDNSHGGSAQWKQVPLRPIISIIARLYPHSLNCHSPALCPSNSEDLTCNGHLGGNSRRVFTVHPHVEDGAHISHADSSNALKKASLGFNCRLRESLQGYEVRVTP